MFDSNQISWQPATSTAIVIPHPFNPAMHLPILAAAGLRIIELNCFDEKCFPWEAASAVRELITIAQNENITIYSMHPPDRGVMACGDPGQIQLRIDTLKRSIDTIAQLHGSVISFHAGYRLGQGENRKKASQQIIYHLAQLADYAQNANITLAVETSTARLDEWNNTELLNAVQTIDHPWLGIVLDTGHCHIAGDLLGFAQKAGPKLVNLHIHDNDGVNDRHSPPGTGTIHWPQFIADLKAANYQGPIMLEAVPTNNPHADAIFCRQKLKQIFNI